ncbi:hypothetical protein ACFE04_001651 [Oxalis oulophora]
MAEFKEYSVLFLIWVISTYVIRIIFAKIRSSHHRLPPSPLALPIIGHFHLLAPIPHQALHKLANKHGPLIRILLGSVPCVVASSPEIAKEFLKTHEASFSDRPMTVAVEYLTYGAADFSFAPYGPYWKFMKKLCMSELLGGRTLDTLLPVRQDEIKRFLSFLLQKSNSNETVDVGRQLVMLTNNIISRMLFGQTCSGSDNEADEVMKLVQDIAELTGKFNLADYLWFCRNLDLQGMRKSLKKVRDKFDALLEKIIMEHEEARKRICDYVVNDLLGILLDISEDETSEIKLTKENIKAFILDIFAAGTDTSAITIEWALAELINHPDIMIKARQEIDTIIGTTTRLVQESDIPNLPYLQAIVKETLRLHPTGPIILREATEDCTIAGYHIPAKTRLFVNVWAIGRDPNHWENPLEFQPERFLSLTPDGLTNGKGSLDVRGQHFHLLPFGTGRRGCPGTSLALQVVQTSLASMIQCFEWRVDNGIVNMDEGPGLTLPRAHPLICVPVARLNLPSF